MKAIWKPNLLLSIFSFCIAFSGFSQKVGLVFSGGGAAGLTHIGVIKALEENEIPIDYITGASFGALVGGLYAAGYTPQEMQRFFESEEFLLALRGNLPERDVYYFTKDRYDASMLNIQLSLDEEIVKALPSNVVTPDLMEYMLIDILEPAAAAANYDFNELFIPFRCVASDIVEKKEVIFSEGSLALALRASSTYPFYFKPIEIDNTMLFDGGLYNNFPSDIMSESFNPDIIIGSNVASSIDPPKSDDLISQVRNMIMRKSEFTIDGNGLIIEPNTNVGVFDFSDISNEIEIGYQATMDRMGDIKRLVGNRRSQIDSLNKKREEFSNQKPSKFVGEIELEGKLNKKQKAYVKSMLGPNPNKDSSFAFLDFKPQYLRLVQDKKIESVYPSTQLDSNSGLFNINLLVERDRDVEFLFGGNISSRPINTGFVGVNYNLFGRTSARLHGNLYFGKFYGGFMTSADIDIGGKKRFSLSPFFIRNRWDYFRSFATFFEQSQPSFIVKNELFGGLTLKASWGNNTVLKLEGKRGRTFDDYYQTENFTVDDTADVTTFDFWTAGFGVDRNTLNRKLYANKGSRFKFSLRYITGDETTEFGSTAADLSEFTSFHDWFEAELNYEYYFSHFGPFHLGFTLDAMYSTKPFFENYNASIISSPGYEPIPESKTIFLEEYRTTEFLGTGFRAVMEIRKNLELRAEAYAFIPRVSILRDEDNKARFSEPFYDQYFIGAGVFVWHSPLGPLSLNLNYYDSKADSPWSFFLNFGYTIFNQKAYEM